MGGVFNPINFAVYHYAGNNPIKYTDPDGKQVTSDDGTTNSAIIKDITQVAGAGFYFDKDNKLQLDPNAKPTGAYDKGVRDSLTSLISGDLKDKDVHILYSKDYMQATVQGSGRTSNLGFTSYGDKDGNSYRVGVPYPLNKNNNGQSASIFLHEFYGHLIPTLQGKVGGNAVTTTMPIIKKLGLTIPEFLKGAWLGQAAKFHDGALPDVGEQGWSEP